MRFCFRRWKPESQTQPAMSATKNVMKALALADIVAIAISMPVKETFAAAAAHRATMKIDANVMDSRKKLQLDR